MSLRTITFEASEASIAALDQAATAQHRNRDSLLQEALEQYLAYDSDFRDAVEEGLRQDDAGDTIDHSEVVAMFHSWKRAAGLK